MKYTIEFDDVFDANKAVELINKIRFGDQPKLERSHNQGSLKFEIEEVEYHLLKHYRNRFTVLK